MRAFIAIEVPGSVKDALARIESHLKYSGADVKWVSPGNIHLTVKFLGEIDGKKAAEVAAALDAVARAAKPFELSVKDLGAFPNAEHPRVVWAGLGKGAAETAALAADIDCALEKLGFEKEARPFNPHLTIGRVRSPLNKGALKEKMASAAATVDLSLLPSHTISSVTLFQSTLTPKGSIYTKVHESGFSS
jgi:2'-5' RNA ligase